MGSSAFEVLLLEEMLCMLRVAITLLEKAMKSTSINNIDILPPKKVLYSGYFLNLRSSVSQNTSHFVIISPRHFSKAI
jgi:predicted class III extradiol MEMO1 family dioxygenase